MRSPGDYARTIFNGGGCTCKQDDVIQCRYCLCVMLFQEVCAEARPGEQMLQVAYGKGLAAAAAVATRWAGCAHGAGQRVAEGIAREIERQDDS